MIKRTVALVAVLLLVGCEPLQISKTSVPDLTNSEYCTLVQSLKGWNDPHGNVYSCEFPNGDRCYIVAVGGVSMECEFSETEQ